MRILVQCFRFAIAGFVSARFYECDITNDSRGFVIIVSRSLPEFSYCDVRIDCARCLGTILKAFSAYSRDVFEALPCSPHGAACIAVLRNNERMITPALNWLRCGVEIAHIISLIAKSSTKAAESGA